MLTFTDKSKVPLLLNTGSVAYSGGRGVEEGRRVTAGSAIDIVDIVVAAVVDAAVVVVAMVGDKAPASMDELLANIKRFRAPV